MLDSHNQQAIMTTTASQYRQGYYQKIGDIMQAITTKYLGPTNTKGSRIKATCWLKSKTVPWDYSLNTDQNHNAAIDALIAELNENRLKSEYADCALWQVVATGSSTDGKGYTAIIDLK